MTITFTEAEKISMLSAWGFTIHTVMGFIDTELGQVDYPVRIATDPESTVDYQEVLKGIYYLNIQSIYGIDTVFRNELKARLMKILVAPINNGRQ